MRLLTVATAILTLSVQSPGTALRLEGSMPLPGVEGRIDHLSVDLPGQRLFVAALGNNTMEVVDLGAKRLVKSVTGLHEPQGIRYLPDRKRVVVANGGNGAVVYLDGGTFAIAATAATAGDADNVRYDQKSGRVYVGYGNGAIGIFDTDGKSLATIALAAHPESFQLETSGPRVFVNVPGAHQIAVIDRDTRAVVATWPVTAAASNYPMALDEAHQRLFVGCRQPARMLVYDTIKGSMVTSIDIVGDTDDLFYDTAKQRVYVVGGEGFVTVIEQQDADRYRQVDRIPTAAGARTGLFVPELGKLFVAVPHRGAQLAEVRAFVTGGV